MLLLLLLMLLLLSLLLYKEGIKEGHLVVFSSPRWQAGKGAEFKVLFVQKGGGTGASRNNS
jgi:hypothetical protein